MPLILLRNGITDFMSNKTLDLRTGMQQWAAFNPLNTTTLCFTTMPSYVKKTLVLQPLGFGN